MAVIDNETAQDFILAKFKTAWDANAAAANTVTGAVPDVEWPNVALPAPPLSSGNRPWARITVKHNQGWQRSLGEKGGRRFTHRGQVTVQVFSPAGKQGLVPANRLGKVALDAFEGEESSDVWFQNAIQKEIGIDGNWVQVNVVADFQYDVIK